MKRTPKRPVSKQKIKTQEIPGFSFWCRIADVFQSITTGSVDEFKLNELVIQFNLTADLMSR